MRTNFTAAYLAIAIAAIVALSSTVGAAPSLDIRKPPVQPPVSYTGPVSDPNAALGQWFRDRMTGLEEPRTHEFYDNAMGYGGGTAGTVAISGVVTNIIYSALNSYIVGFTVKATIRNDTPASTPWNMGQNSHGEVLTTNIQYEGVLKDVKLVCSFASDPQLPPPMQWVPPYTKQTPEIYSTDHEQLAWYCWTPNNPINKMPYGSYYVPAYDFGDIPPRQMVSRFLNFVVSGAGLPPADPRYSVIQNSQLNNDDIFLNRTTSLKVSDWMDTLYTDAGAPYFDLGKGSDVSVFHNTSVQPTEQDWGDAPEVGYTYPTTSANGGAFHTIVPGLCLGTIEDAEADGQPDPNALGDDNNPPTGPDDEDGIVWNSPLVPGSGAQITVNCTVPPGSTAYLNAWIDYGIDGSWAEAGDKVISDAVVSNGANAFTFVVPAAANPGTTFARFRLSTQPGLGYGGGAQDGEVEDEQVMIEAARDFGDARDGVAAPGYPTLLVNNGAWHKILPGFCLGANIDGEADGQPTVKADGDDKNPVGGPDDEDGVTFNTALVPGANASITVTTTVPTGMSAYLDGWIDFNADGNWTTPGDQIFAAQPLPSGTVTLTFPVPSSAAVGVKTYARFRLSSVAAGLPFVGGAPDGEVEDYLVDIGYKWTQEPDLDPTGIDVCATYPYILADDFMCTVTGPITDIHVWGSWLGDILPGEGGSVGNPNNVTFTLSIHEDVPGGPNIPSHPGKVLWYRTFHPGQFVAHQYAANLREGWMYPPSDYDPAGDTVCWQYDFYIDQEPFIQRGTQENPKVYWLDVQAMPQGQMAKFGWKTSRFHWNDDATWGQGSEPYPGPWTELRYPPNHEFYPQSIDLAFAITGRTAAIDWGDAPDGPYPTLNASGGANHTIVQGFCLGNLIDGEADGQPNPIATGDDISNQPDEDGLVILPPLVPGQNVTIGVFLTDTVGYPAFLDAWIDFNADGSWLTPGDQIANAMPLAAGTNVVTFVVPRTFVANPIPTFARFRLSSIGGLPPTGAASDGEVEDYNVKIEPDRGTLIFTPAIALNDHFWWPGITDPYNEMISMKVSTDTIEPVSWNSLDLLLSGGVPGDVARVSVWQDVNGNGNVEPAIDIPLGSLAIPSGAVTINFATPPVIPAGGSIMALVAYQMSSGAPGTVYTCRAINAAGTGQLSGLAAYITGLPIGSCRKIAAPSPITIGEAKKLPPGSQFLLVGKEVTANFLGTSMNLFYIEEKDRSNGIGVNPTLILPPSLTIGDTVSVLGTSFLLNGTELVVSPQQILKGVHMLPFIAPVGMNNKWTGGGQFGSQPAVYDKALPLPGTPSVGLNNVGCLIRTWGLVTYHDPAFMTPSISGPMFWIDDGSNLRDGFWKPTGGATQGVACLYLGPMGAFPDVGEYWAVTGILRSIPNGNLIPQAVRLLVPRKFPDDLTEYPVP